MAGTSKQLAEDVGPKLNLPLVTLQTLMKQSAKQHPDNIALICPHQPPDYLHQRSQPSIPGNDPPYLRWTYTQPYNAASTLAARLYALGIRKDMRIAAILRNGAHWAVGLWAAALLGCPFVSINPSFANKVDDIQHMLATADASAIMVEDASMATEVDATAGPKLVEKMIVKLMTNEIQDDYAQIAGDWTTLESLPRPDQDREPMPPEDQTRTRMHS